VTDPLRIVSIIEAFSRLGDRLARRGGGVVADVYVFGGAAMALAYDARRATRDIDAIFQPQGVVLDEARAMPAIDLDDYCRERCPGPPVPSRAVMRQD